MRAIVLENDYKMGPTILAWIHNRPGMFTTMKTAIGINRRPLTDLMEELEDRDAIIIESTFQDMDQVEVLLGVFHRKGFGDIPFKFFVVDFTSDLNTWSKEYPELKDKLVHMVQNYEVYDVYSADLREYRIWYWEEHDLFCRLKPDSNEPIKE